MVAAVAAGAFAAAGQAMAADEEQADSGHDEYTPLAAGQNVAASFGSVATEDATESGTASAGKAPASKASASSTAKAVGGAMSAPNVLPVAKPSESDTEVRQLAKSEQIAKKRAEAREPDYVAPAEGRFTSGFGGRWGTTHYGIDIANNTGTEIRSVADGTVIEAGSASGFGLWVRVLHDDGTITVYGHVHTITVDEGERVEAGEQIATMGNRGFSTGTHLHFEVWDTDGRKINPVPWLNERGVDVT
ncbi:M23 family metallopeptidase [Haloactinomyces albus]|uniref:M23 family metallopeptidase n=1 Tax=Haloactinomyces albus TaxID=1352928 RepID=UPI00286AA18E|nr:M23 family metallopeptidase [Haloactinomyces albus]